jgi:hypothetical protein
MHEPQWNDKCQLQQKFDVREFSMFAPPPMNEESQTTSASITSEVSNPGGSTNDSELFGYDLGFQLPATTPYSPDAGLSFDELWSSPFLRQPPELGEGFFLPYSMDLSSSLMHYDSSPPIPAQSTSGIPGLPGNDYLPFPPQLIHNDMQSEAAYGVTYVPIICAATLLIHDYDRYDELETYLTNASGLGDELFLQDIQF